MGSPPVAQPPKPPWMRVSTSGVRMVAAFGFGVVATLVVTRIVNRAASFEECMVRSLKGSPNNEAAIRVIARACRAKFPSRSLAGSETRSLDFYEVGALTGRAGIVYGNRYGGDLYNGNTDLTVTEVEIEVRAIRGRDTTARKYRTSVLIAPRATAHFGFDIIVGDPGSTYDWSISSAWGHPSGR